MDLSLPLEEVRGVGPKTAEALSKANLHTIRDILYFLPRTYENYSHPTSISDIEPGLITVRAKASSIKTRYVRAHMSITEATLSDETGSIRAVWFNQPYRAKQLAPDTEYIFSGDYNFSRNRYQLTNPSSIKASDISSLDSTIKPVYPQRAGLKSVQTAKLIGNLRTNIARVKDLIPDMKGRADALFGIHFPSKDIDISDARNYLALEELFCFILAAKMNREEVSRLPSIPVQTNLAAIKSFIAKLPFKPTNAQRRAAWDIIQDLSKQHPMNRLLHGDVGSGKTLVAALAALSVADAGYQVAILAPTEVLAHQHAEEFAKLLPKLNIALLTGSTKHKLDIKKRIASGEAQIIIGTHAIITDDTKFHKLALAVIDEQHRFGVQQRQKLIAKSGDGVLPHLLSMTATPIPRSLQLTLFGDLDVSTLDEMPPGRTPVKTQIVAHENSSSIWSDLLHEAQAGHQIYYICKAIDISVSELKTVTKEAERIKDKVGRNAKVATLHGRMKGAEKEQIMTDFVRGKIDILVSTTVVEVGVNNPNATRIVVENADRYGLAQVHQLRGRVGRSNLPSMCYLITSDGAQPTRRLRELERSTDGFYLAEVDLELRGPGEIYGTLQHGALDLKIASFTDTRTISKAQKLVDSFLQNQPDMLQFPELTLEVNKYQKITTLN